MKYFFDTEFIEDGKTIDLISIGIVAEDGREFYAQNIEAKLENANEWVRQNVFPHLKAFRADLIGKGVPLDPTDDVWMQRDVIANNIIWFVGSDPQPEFWAYNGAYDWVIFCQLFGTMSHMPRSFPNFVRDIKQLNEFLGNRQLPKAEGLEHHALDDARWNQKAWQFLTNCGPS
jgi:inhibitor of KinA sporulation pathway (predicted exonuclease)